MDGPILKDLCKTCTMGKMRDILTRPLKSLGFFAHKTGFQSLG